MILYLKIGKDNAFTRCSAIAILRVLFSAKSFLSAKVWKNV